MMPGAMSGAMPGYMPSINTRQTFDDGKPIYDGFTFTCKDPLPGDKRTWALAEKARWTQKKQAELIQMVKKEKEVSGEATTVMRSKELRPYKVGHVQQLLNEHNRMERDPSYEWVIAMVRPKYKSVGIKEKITISIDVIIKRVSRLSRSPRGSFNRNVETSDLRGPRRRSSLDDDLVHSPRSPFGGPPGFPGQMSGQGFGGGNPNIQIHANGPRPNHMMPGMGGIPGRGAMPGQPFPGSMPGMGAGRGAMPGGMPGAMSGMPGMNNMNGMPPRPPMPGQGGMPPPPPMYPAGGAAYTNGRHSPIIEVFGGKKGKLGKSDHKNKKGKTKPSNIQIHNDQYSDSDSDSPPSRGTPVFDSDNDTVLTGDSSYASRIGEEVPFKNNKSRGHRESKGSDGQYSPKGYKDKSRRDHRDRSRSRSRSRSRDRRRNTDRDGRDHDGAVYRVHGIDNRKNETSSRSRRNSFDFTTVNNSQSRRPTLPHLKTFSGMPGPVIYPNNPRPTFATRHQSFGPQGSMYPHSPQGMRPGKYSLASPMASPMGGMHSGTHPLASPMTAPMGGMHFPGMSAHGDTMGTLHEQHRQLDREIEEREMKRDIEAKHRHVEELEKEDYRRKLAEIEERMARLNEQEKDDRLNHYDRPVALPRRPSHVSPPRRGGSIYGGDGYRRDPRDDFRPTAGYRDDVYERDSRDGGRMGGMRDGVYDRPRDAYTGDYSRRRESLY